MPTARFRYGEGSAQATPTPAQQERDTPVVPRRLARQERGTPAFPASRNKRAALRRPSFGFFGCFGTNPRSREML